MKTKLLQEIKQEIENIRQRENCKPSVLLQLYRKEVGENNSGFNNAGRQEVRKILIAIFQEMDVPFEDWQEAMHLFNYGVWMKECPFVADKMAEKAKTFQHWNFIYKKPSFCAKYQNIAIRKMDQLAKTESELEAISRIKKKNRFISTFFVNQENMQTLSDWIVACQHLGGNPEKQRVLDSIMELEFSIGELCETYVKCKESDVKAALEKKISSITASLEEWCAVILDYDKCPELKSVAIKKLKKILNSKDI